MKTPKIIVITALVTILAIGGCGTKPTSISTQVTTQAKTNAEVQKAKEKAYYDAVKAGTEEVTTSMGKMNSLLVNYNSSKAQDLGNSIVDISIKVEKVAAIDPPPGYEHVQTLYKQGADSLIKALFTLTEGLDKKDSSEIKTGLNYMDQSSKTIVQAINEMKSILSSHGISY